MFIINNAKENLIYRAHGNVLTLVPGLNHVKDTEFRAEELKNHFGHFITINREEIEELEPELNIAPKNEICEKCGKEPCECVSEEELAKIKIAEEYFANIALDDDSDKHLKLEIAKRLRDEAAEKEERVYDNISLMEEIEKLFPEEQANKLAELEAETKKKAEVKKATNKTTNKSKAKTTNKKTANK